MLLSLSRGDWLSFLTLANGELIYSGFVYYIAVGFSQTQADYLWSINPVIPFCPRTLLQTPSVPTSKRKLVKVRGHPRASLSRFRT